MSKRDRTITVPLKFTEDDLNTILKSASFGDGKPLTVKDVIRTGRWEEFKKELIDTRFLDEIMEGTYEACANDWMCEFAPDSDS